MNGDKLIYWTLIWLAAILIAGAIMGGILIVNLKFGA